MDLYRAIFDHTPDAMLVVTPEGNIVDCNQRAQSLFGMTAGDLCGAAIDRLIPPRMAVRHRTHLQRYFAEPKVRQMGAPGMELLALHSDGREFPVDIMIAPLDTRDGQFALCAVRDISAHKAIEMQLRQRTAELEILRDELQVLAGRDELTGLPNRRAFNEQGDWLLRHASRRNECLSILMIDLDHFKAVNDRLGHATGDIVLRGVAGTIGAQCRANDMAARYGGEEFVLALPATDREGSLVVAEGLRAAVESLDTLPVRLTASIGATTLPAGASIGRETLTVLLNEADRALYAAKWNGRNRICHIDHLKTSDDTARHQ